MLQAVLLYQTLMSMDLPGVEHKAEVIQALSKQITQGQTRTKKGNKAQKVSLSYVKYFWIWQKL